MDGISAVSVRVLQGNRTNWRHWFSCCLGVQLCPTLCGSIDYGPPGSSVRGIQSGENAGVGCHFLLSGIFLTPNPGIKPASPALEVDSLPLSHLGSPTGNIQLYTRGDLFWELAHVVKKTRNLHCLLYVICKLQESGGVIQSCPLKAEGPEERVVSQFKTKWE